MRQINVAIVGLGQIGNYLYNELITKKKDIEIKTRKKIQIVAISAKNKNKKRKFKINKKIFYKNPLDIIKDKKADNGYDARNDEYVKMFEAGIIDPTKVARVAVQNAASIAGMILTTEAAITEIPEDDKMPPMPPGGDMGGMGGMGGMM